jgi:Ulp1 family protease
VHCDFCEGEAYPVSRFKHCCTGKSHMDIVLRYLVDEDKGQRHIKHDEWALVTSIESVPQQENTFDCGAFICMFGYFISQDASLVFNQANVTSF